MSSAKLKWLAEDQTLMSNLFESFENAGCHRVRTADQCLNEHMSQPFPQKDVFQSPSRAA